MLKLQQTLHFHFYLLLVVCRHHMVPFVLLSSDYFHSIGLQSVDISALLYCTIATNAKCFSKLILINSRLLAQASN